MNMTGYIYKITNTKNKKVYIGKTTQSLKRRFQQHSSNAYNDKKKFRELHLYRAIRKYGLKNFVIEMIEETNIETLNEREKYWIDYYDSTNNEKGYNLTGGGDGGLNMLPSTIKKIVATKKKNNHTKLSEETKRKISEKMKGAKFSEEHKKHLSDNHHLKTTHILYFKDGHTELSRDSIKTLANKLKVTAVMLRRASEVGEFRCGEFYLLDLTNLELAFNHKHRFSKEKCVIDPVSNKVVSVTTLRALHQHHPELYENYIPYNFIGSKKKEKEEFIEKYEGIKRKALEGGK